jgi:hypothetical protein
MVRRIFDPADPVQCTDRVVEETAYSNSKFYNLQTYCSLYSVYCNTCTTAIYKSVQSCSKALACFGPYLAIFREVFNKEKHNIV